MLVAVDGICKCQIQNKHLSFLIINGFPSNIPDICIWSLYLKYMNFCIFQFAMGSNTYQCERLNKDNQQPNKTLLATMWYSLPHQKCLGKPLWYSAGKDKQEWTDCLIVCFKNLGVTFPSLFLWGPASKQHCFRPNQETKETPSFGVRTAVLFSATCMSLNIPSAGSCEQGCRSGYAALGFLE